MISQWLMNFGKVIITETFVLGASPSWEFDGCVHTGVGGPAKTESNRNSARKLSPGLKKEFINCVIGSDRELERGGSMEV